MLMSQRGVSVRGGGVNARSQVGGSERGQGRGGMERKDMVKENPRKRRRKGEGGEHDSKGCVMLTYIIST